VQCAVIYFPFQPFESRYHVGMSVLCVYNILTVAIQCTRVYVGRYHIIYTSKRTRPHAVDNNRKSSTRSASAAVNIVIYIYIGNKDPYK